MAGKSSNALGITPYAWMVAGEERFDRSDCSGSGSVSPTAWLDLEGQDSPSDVKKLLLASQ